MERKKEIKKKNEKVMERKEERKKKITERKKKERKNSFNQYATGLKQNEESVLVCCISNRS